MVQDFNSFYYGFYTGCCGWYFNAQKIQLLLGDRGKCVM